MGFSRKNTIIWHENLKKKEWRPLTFNASGPMKKTNKQKTHEIKWSQSCFFFFFPWLINENEKAMSLNALFHGVRSYGVLIRVVKFMPHLTKPSVFRERLNINGLWKWNGFWWHFHYPRNMPLAYFSWERQRQWPSWKFSLKLFSTVKSNTLFVVVKITLKIIIIIKT